MDPTRRSMSSPRRILLVGVLIFTAMGMGVLLAGAQTDQGTPAASPDAACVTVSPQAAGSTPSAVASPASLDPMDPDTPRLGTPAAGPCLTVTLGTDKATAGPRQLIVTILDADGAPVTDAMVTILTRHLGMDHGISTSEAAATEPGRYAIEQVPMGMGGTWQADVVITRPGYKPVTVTFLVDLEGPA